MNLTPKSGFTSSKICLYSGKYLSSFPFSISKYKLYYTDPDDYREVEFPFEDVLHDTLCGHFLLYSKAKSLLNKEENSKALLIELISNSELKQYNNATRISDIFYQFLDEANNRKINSKIIEGELIIDFIEIEKPIIEESITEVKNSENEKNEPITNVTNN